MLIPFPGLGRQCEQLIARMGDEDRSGKDMNSETSAFPGDFALDAFFTAMPANLKASARNGEGHLKIIKAQGRMLQGHLNASHALELSSAQALDAAARSYGFTDYNQARAVLLASGQRSASSATVHSELPADPWVSMATVFQEGGFVVGNGDGPALDYAVRARPGVITAYDAPMTEEPPKEWYFTRTRGPFSKVKFEGKGSVVVRPLDPLRETAQVPRFIDRAARLDAQGFRSYLLLSRAVVSNRDLRELLAIRQAFIPVVEGYAYPGSGMEGVPDFLWDSAYAVFLSQTETTDALFRHVPHVAKALGVTEERALYLLSRVPSDRYLRIPPARQE
jgi:hypothetical protein